MKFSISLFLAIVFLSSIQLQAQDNTPVVLQEYQEVTDTIINFNPETFEETVQIVRRKVKEDTPIPPAIQIENMQSDTIIYFDKDTYEERVVIVNRKGENRNDLNVLPAIEEGAQMQVDTIITFDPQTRKETMQIVRRKKS